jgi:hypothetical protein
VEGAPPVITAPFIILLFYLTHFHSSSTMIHMARSFRQFGGLELKEASSLISQGCRATSLVTQSARQQKQSITTRWSSGATRQTPLAVLVSLFDGSLESAN